MKGLIILRDKHPQFRPDLAVLFHRELAGRGHGFDWRMQSEAGLERTRRVPWAGGEVVVAPRTSRLRWYHRVWNNLRDLANDVTGLLTNKGYDFVQVKDKFLVALLGPLAARRNGGRFVYWLSYPFPESWMYEARQGTALYPLVYGLRGRLCFWLLYRVILPSADHVMVQSERMREDVAAQGIPREKMTAVPMGVDLENFPAPAPAPENKVVLYLGSMIRVRGLEFLLGAFARVLREEPEARLVMVGEGKTPADLEFLKAEAGRLGIAEAVEFTGFMDRDAAFARVAGAAVCVSPFKPSPVLDSTSPTKLSEYLALGRPVVANDHPEQSLVLSECGAGVVTPWEEEAFAGGILQLLRLPASEREELGRRGWAWVEQNRTYASIADLVERTYENICRGRGAA
ncbi:MAG: glycosyltransferase [Desulfovibrionaceae bacterium]